MVQLIRLHTSVCRIDGLSGEEVHFVEEVERGLLVPKDGGRVGSVTLWVLVCVTDGPPKPSQTLSRLDSVGRDRE